MLGMAGAPRHSTEQHRSNRSATAAVGNLGEETQGRDAQIRSDFYGVVVVHAVLGDAIDIAGFEAGIGDGVADRLNRQAHFTATRIPRILSVTDTNDRRLVFQRLHAGPPSAAIRA